MSQVFIVVSIVVLACIAVPAFFWGKSRKENGLTPLSTLAFGCSLAGILYGVGVILTVIDMLRRSKSE